MLLLPSLMRHRGAGSTGYLKRDPSSKLTIVSFPWNFFRKIFPATRDFDYLPLKRDAAPYIRSNVCSSLMSLLKNTRTSVSQDCIWIFIVQPMGNQEKTGFLPQVPWFLTLKSRTLMPVVFLVTLKSLFWKSELSNDFLVIHWVSPFLRSVNGSSSVGITKKENVLYNV